MRDSLEFDPVPYDEQCEQLGRVARAEGWAPASGRWGCAMRVRIFAVIAYAGLWLACVSGADFDAEFSERLDVVGLEEFCWGPNYGRVAEFRHYWGEEEFTALCGE